MPDDIARAEWVQRVLGFEFPGGIAGDASMLDQWEASKSVVDRQLQALSNYLLKSEIPVLAEIARELGDVLTPADDLLTHALKDYDAQPGTAETRTAALKAVTETLDWLGTNERVKAIDTNPFGVSIDVAGLLGNALGRLQTRLTTARGEQP